MALPNKDRLLARLEAYANDAAARNYHAQAHARSILQGLKSSESAWPQFSRDLNKRLYYGAHFQIWTALELLNQEQGKEQAQQALLDGAEALEFICEDPGLESAVRSEQLLKAGFAYYVAGHYARSYVLINELLARANDLPRPLALLVAVLQKHLGHARGISLAIFSDLSLHDAGIASELEAAEIGPDEAVSRAISLSLSGAVSFYLEYLKTGERGLFEEALRTVNDMILLTRESLFVDWWWWSFCLRHLLLEYDRGSLWTQLTPFGGEGPNGDSLILGYIRAGLRQVPPIVELWPSQAQAVPVVNRADRPHFCLKMPTSSGKTRIAEMTILRFFVDKKSNPLSKCAYVAPFRSLAVEVERTLQQSVGPLGIRISEIYGGFDLSPEDRRLIEETQILVATPEKFDALFRFAPDIGSRIGLVIIDEGHVIKSDERGLHFEFFLQRLIKRLTPTGCRFLFISAVLPNAAEFAEWITGAPSGLLESKWRPSRLMLGRLSWDGKAVRIDYTHSEQDKFDQECYVPSFVTIVPCKGVQGLGRRTLDFPKDKDEAFGAAALQFALTGTTLIFCPQKRQVQSFARKLEEILRARQALSRAKNERFDLPTPGIGTPEWARCKKAIQEEMGTESELLGLLDAGIVVHHGGLPQRVRVAFEDLVRSRGCQLLVATTTLAQGVNLPIKTVLVRGLYHGHNDLVSPLTFWNICGRAGRGMKETEGQILFCVDRTGTVERRRRTNHAIEQMISAIDKKKVASAIRLVLSLFVKEWKNSHPSIDFSTLCLYLAENNLEWISEDRRPEFKPWLDRLDGHLLALTEEFDLDPYTPDRLQKILSGSLLFIQLRDSVQPVLSAEDAVAFCDARIRYIHRKHPQRTVRSRLFKLGLPLQDCESIETRKDSLLTLFAEADAWAAWTAETRAKYLVRLAEIVLELREIKPSNGLPAQFRELLTSWLLGASAVEMAADSEISKFSDDPTDISLWIEDVCRYRLPWGMNSLTSFLQSYATEVSVAVPGVCPHFTSMFKYGSIDPIAIRLMPYVDNERSLALSLAAICPLGIDDLGSIPSWFMALTKTELVASGLAEETTSRIIELQEASSRRRKIRRSRTRSIRIPFSDSESAGGLGVGDKVLIIPKEGNGSNSFALWTLRGKLLGAFTFSRHPVPEWWRTPHLVVSSISDVETAQDGKVILTVDTAEI
jgi:superfamily II DNA/RNA helicase